VAEKKLKAKVHYRQEGKGDHRCKNCTMFRGPHGCTDVQGNINPEGVCDIFYAKRSKS